MIQVLHVTNPFQPFENLIREQAFPGQTIRSWLRGFHGLEFQEFELPTLCQLNGQPIMREQWDDLALEDGDVLVFVTLPGEPVTIILAVIAIVVAIFAVLLVPDPRIPAETGASDSVYTLKGQNNRIRPNEPIEVVYGKCRVWPTFLTRPYSRYSGNQQFQFSLFCVGQGDFTIHDTFFDDTSVEDFEEVEIEYVPPGGELTLIDSAVYPALEVSNIELLGPDEDLYEGISGPFTINDIDKPITRIEIDIAFPQGLYILNGKGYLQDWSVEVLFEYREIDAAGDPIGSWETHTATTITRSDNTPQRITFSATVPAGRYEIRGQRITDKLDSPKIASQLYWETAKGYSKLENNFGDVYLIAMKALATNQLNDQTSKSFNVSCTRKLPTWTPEDGWIARSATRNPVWAMCDVFRATYGAKLTSEYLDMDNLHALAEVYETREDWFDWVFDEPITVWEAARTVMRVGRASPIAQGSLITAIRDKPSSMVSAVFNQYNIVKGSLSKSLNMFEFQPFDGLTVEYTDQDTWKPKEVDCILPGRDGLNLDKLKLPGCTNRNRALREGLYIQARRELQRKTVTFQTGLEGHIPTFMDLISITHDTVRVGQGGMVLAYNSTTKVMTLSEQVEFASSHIQHVIALRGPDGAILGDPIVVTPGASANKVILAEDPAETLDFSSDQVPPLYAFGVTDIWSFLGKVVSVKPVDNQTVEITAVNYAPASYDFDEEVAEEVVGVNVINNPNNLRVDWVTLASAPRNREKIYVDFSPVAGAAGYILQTSYNDGTTWEPAGNYNAPPILLVVNPGTIKVRVAPFSLGGKPRWRISDALVVGSYLPTPDAPDLRDTQPDFVGTYARVRWNAVTGADGYLVDVYTDSVLMRQIEVGSALRADYTFDMYTEDGGTGRTIEFRIRSFNGPVESDDTIYEQTNPVPVAPTGLTNGAPTGTLYPISYDYTEQGDELEVRFYGSTTPGFTADGSTLLGLGLTQINAPVTPYYWRVGVVDIWGTEVGLSAEATIS